MPGLAHTRMRAGARQQLRTVGLGHLCEHRSALEVQHDGSGAAVYERGRCALSAAGTGGPGGDRLRSEPFANPMNLPSLLLSRHKIVFREH